MQQYLINEFGIKSDSIKRMEEVESTYSLQFKRADDIAAYNQLKVLKAFQNNRVSYAHFGETSGYGYDDLGRDTLDRIYAEIFGAEDALVRHHIVSGTQAIASCLYAVINQKPTFFRFNGRRSSPDFNPFPIRIIIVEIFHQKLVSAPINHIVAITDINMPKRGVPTIAWTI